jgi:hypothetical protein
MLLRDSDGLRATKAITGSLLPRTMVDNIVVVGCNVIVIHRVLFLYVIAIVLYIYNIVFSPLYHDNKVFRCMKWLAMKKFDPTTKAQWLVMKKIGNNIKKRLE